MAFKRRKYRYKSGNQVRESRVVTITLIVGILLVILLIYLFG